MEWRDLQAQWDGDLASIRPLGDFVLVRPFPMEHGTGSLIINPNVHMTKDGRWRSNRLKGNQMGEVVAVGKGDRTFALGCENCTKHGDMAMFRLESAKNWSCRDCGSSLVRLLDVTTCTFHQGRAEMNVQPGDVVIYPQVPSNEVSINGERMIFLHEEQHVLAVLEQERA